MHKVHHSHICTQYTIHTYAHSTPFTHMHKVHHSHICTQYTSPYLLGREAPLHCNQRGHRRSSRAQWVVRVCVCVCVCCVCACVCACICMHLWVCVFTCTCMFWVCLCIVSVMSVVCCGDVHVCAFISMCVLHIMLTCVHMHGLRTAYVYECVCTHMCEWCTVCICVNGW